MMIERDRSRPGGLGRLPATDARDMRFPMRTLLMSAPPQPSRLWRYWHDNAWWGDQGFTSQCVAYAWTHWLEDGPFTRPETKPGRGPLVEPGVIYARAQKIDEWPGEAYEGTSVRAGARVLRERGLIGSFWWAWRLDELIDAVLNLGPVVVGTNWYESMDKPSRLLGTLTVSGSVLGGHAYVVNGVNTITRRFRIKNSWGREWGKEGRAYISFADMERLIAEDGEVVIAREVRPAA